MKKFKQYIEERCCEACASLDEELELTEAEYQGKTVTLNKPVRGGSKKFYVYTKNEKGNVVKVSFGDPNMEIKRDDPGRRKNFRARVTTVIILARSGKHAIGRAEIGN